MSQTMLLTKPLSTFLSTHTTPNLQTLLLLSSTGKVLSSSSPSPASTLRTQATLAVSLWTLYHPFQSTTSPLVSASLPPSNTPPPQNPTQNQEGRELNTITIQLEFGVMCIRALRSGLLFVAISPSSSSTAGPYLSSQQISAGQTSPPGSPGVLEVQHGSTLSLQAAGSEAGSVGTERSLVGSGVWGVRRQAEEVGRLLEGRLEGFGLSGGER